MVCCNRKSVVFSALAVLAAGACSTFSSPAFAQTSLELYKNSYTYYGPNDVLAWSAPSSDWGSVIVNYDGSAQPQYFNLSIDGEWKVANMTLDAFSGVGNATSVVFNFGLSQNLGAMVDVGFQISDSPLDIAPVGGFDAIIAERTLVGSQNQGAIAWQLEVPAIALVGGNIDDGFVHTNFPNQNCDTMFCSPASVSNSLQWLNKTYDLKMPADKISIDALAKVFGTTKNGTPLPWWDKKADYLKNEKLPVMQTVSNKIEDAIEAIKLGKDIELNTQPHAAAIVGIKKLKDGTYEIAVAHDTKQAQDGGTVIEKGKYDPKTNKLTGITWMGGEQLTNFVIEMAVIPPKPPVPEPASWLLMISGFGVAGWGMRRTRSGRTSIRFRS